MVNIILSYIIFAICLIIAITIHEYFHALIADNLGDPTPRSQGRLSLNPLKHLDLLGTIMLFIVHFGWGKPVQIDPYNLKNPKRDEIFISLAGPASNLFLAIILSLLIRIIPINNDIFIQFFSKLIELNVILAIFNLIPIPPLDGSKIFFNLLPDNISIQWQSAFNQYGIILLLVFIFLPIVNGLTLTDIIITPIMNLIFRLLLPGY